MTSADYLIAEGRKHEEATRVGHPACTCNGAAWCDDECPARPRVDRAAEAEAWFVEHRRALLDGYAAALDSLGGCQTALARQYADHNEELRCLRSDLTEATEQRDVYRDRCQQLAAEISQLRAALASAAGHQVVRTVHPDGTRQVEMSGPGYSAEWTEIPRDGGSEATPLAVERDRLTASLRSHIVRIRRCGGYATPEEQEALWEAERIADS